MKLAPFTSQQYVVIQRLFSGPKSSLELRRLLKQAKIRMSASTLSRFMTRLEWGHYIQRQYKMKTIGGRKMRHCSFAVTDFGVNVWKETRQFYLEMEPPPADFVPVSTEGSRIAHLSIEERNAKLIDEMGIDFSWLAERKDFFDR